jgi:uncharacterized protein YndB with AHSA1/START domain
MNKPTFVYVTYIATTLEQLWDALTSEPFTQQFWEDGQLESDWQVGSSVEHVNADGEPDWHGEVLQSEPPHRLSYTVQPLDEPEVEPSRVCFRLEPYGDTVKLTLIHDRLDVQSCVTMSHTWSIRLSYLKHLLELEESFWLVA